MKNPNWPTGLEQMCADRGKGDNAEQLRNVIDPFKSWTAEAIKAELDTRRNKFSVLLENYAYDINIATSIRNANAFVAKDIWITGRRQFNKKGCVGTHNYQHIYYYENSADILASAKQFGRKIVCLDNIEGAVNINQFTWPEDCVMVFGAESIGVSQTALDMADDVVYIPQYGSTRSLNVGVASGIAMYDYCMKAENVQYWTET